MSDGRRGEHRASVVSVATSCGRSEDADVATPDTAPDAGDSGPNTYTRVGMSLNVAVATARSIRPAPPARTAADRQRSIWSLVDDAAAEKSSGPLTAFSDSAVFDEPVGVVPAAAAALVAVAADADVGVGAADDATGRRPATLDRSAPVELKAPRSENTWTPLPTAPFPTAPVAPPGGGVAVLGARDASDGELEPLWERARGIPTAPARTITAAAAPTSTWGRRRVSGIGVRSGSSRPSSRAARRTASMESARSRGGTGSTEPRSRSRTDSNAARRRRHDAHPSRCAPIDAVAARSDPGVGPSR